MELDKRIKEGKKPLNCFDTEQAKQFIGKQCYFADNIEDFSNLDNVSVIKGFLTDIDDDEMISGCFKSNGIRSSFFGHFIVPCEWVKTEKKEPKYRPYTIDDFLKKFKLGDSIILKRKDKNAYEVALFTGYYDKGIYLGAYDCKLEYLFSDYELGVNYDEFVPFGVLEDD